MITPPLDTRSFYTVSFHHDAAKFMAGLLSTAETDIQTVLVMSVDMTSDIEAVDELTRGVKDVIDNLVQEGEEHDAIITYNPLYLPTPKTGDVFDYLNLDNGEVTITGFINPFISMELKLSTERNLNVIEGRVNYRQFEFPPIEDLIQPQAQYLS